MCRGARCGSPSRFHPSRYLPAQLHLREGCQLAETDRFRLDRPRAERIHAGRKSLGHAKLYGSGDHPPEPTDKRLDIFALGVTAYQLCTFELPWPSQDVSGKAAVAHDNKPPGRYLSGVAPAGSHAWGRDHAVPAAQPGRSTANGAGACSHDSQRDRRRRLIGPLPVPRGGFKNGRTRLSLPSHGPAPCLRPRLASLACRYPPKASPLFETRSRLIATVCQLSIIRDSQIAAGLIREQALPAVARSASFWHPPGIMAR